MDLLGIHPGPFLGIKVHIWNIFLNINSKNHKNQNLNFKSQHLVINPDQGPPLKCAPGHDSIKDASIIKSYCPKSGVMDKQNIKTEIWGIWGWGLLIGSILLHGSVLRGTIQQNVSWKRSAEALGKHHFVDRMGADCQQILIYRGV